MAGGRIRGCDCAVDHDGPPAGIDPYGFDPLGASIGRQTCKKHRVPAGQCERVAVLDLRIPRPYIQRSVSNAEISVTWMC